MKLCPQCEKENPSSARRKFIVETRCFVSPYSVSVWRLCNFVAKQRCDKSRPYTNLCGVQYKSILKACLRPVRDFRSLPKAHRRVLKNSDFVDGCNKQRISVQSQNLEVEPGEVTQDDFGKWEIIEKQKLNSYKIMKLCPQREKENPSSANCCMYCGVVLSEENLDETVRLQREFEDAKCHYHNNVNIKIHIDQGNIDLRVTAGLNCWI